MISTQELAAAMPPALKSQATDSLANILNNIASDPLVAETMRENFITYSHVLKDGKYKMDSYLSAIKYVSFKMMNLSNAEAYEKTFPQRMAALIAAGTSKKDISSYVAMYHKGKLVQAILEQSLVPVWLLNQETYQRAINVQADLMMNAQSEMVRTTAASSVLSTLEPPKESKIELSLGEKDVSVIADLRDAVSRLASEQAKVISSGSMTAKQIAATPLIIEGQVDG